jgi:hypothetical protein
MKMAEMIHRLVGKRTHMTESSRGFSFVGRTVPVFNSSPRSQILVQDNTFGNDLEVGHRDHNCLTRPRDLEPI